MADDSLAQSALHYHRLPTPGKLTVMPTKPVANQRDLTLAYSPGVAEACKVIVDDPAEAATLTIRANLVGVVTNGTAVLGLGAIGPLAAKPVMEGKAVLFKKFAGIDVFDIEIDETDPKKMIEIIAALEPTFGAINLEDIKAPECFEVERALKERMNIPVFHDDQHGTAIVVSAAIINALRLARKNLKDVKIVSTGGGAAGIACLNLLVKLGAERKNITLVDHIGVVYEGREEDVTDEKLSYAQKTPARTLGEAMGGADIFLGLSAGGILKPDMVERMAKQPIILALANPDPEILPEDAKAVRSDVMIATGRTDYPNQVNNVLCFPYIFRGALDVGASDINDAMVEAAVHTVADIVRAGSSDIAAAAYGETSLTFGPEYLIPKPFDPRLVVEIPCAIAKAAMDSGIAARPIADLDRYKQDLYRFVYRSGLVMRPVFDRARTTLRRIAFAEGEDERVLYALKAIVDERLADPVLIGRPQVIEARLERLGLNLVPGTDFEIVNPESDERYRDYWSHYVERAGRRGVTPDLAKTRLRTSTTVIGSIMLDRGEVDAMLCGTYGSYPDHLRHVLDIIGLRPDEKAPSTLALAIHQKGPIFLTDCYIALDPDAEQIVEQTLLAAEEMRCFGIEPRVALISHSTFGSRKSSSATKMRDALAMLKERAPDLMVDGEMQTHAALDPEVRDSIFPNSTLEGIANLLVFPELNSANSALNLMRTLGDAQLVGPLLLGLQKPAHILSPSATARGIVNVCAVAAATCNDVLLSRRG
ncbi:NADP-dependent malic enzyme [bacterium MnTg02]|nr:NADP-dependent malic enzyme [bacterium MnTg02]